MSLEGRLIEFLDADTLRVAYVRKQDHDKLHVIDPRGRNLSVSGDRVIVVHGATAESDVPAAARVLQERVGLKQVEVDVELLWQSLGGKERPLEPSELATLFFSDNSPESASAVFRALFEDSLFFKRKGTQFVPRSPQQVETELQRRQREREHEEFRTRARQTIAGLLRKPATEIQPADAPIVERIHAWFRLKNGDEVGGMLEQIAGPAKAREAAYDILVRAGHIDPGCDRFLILAGVDERFPAAVVEAAEKLPAFAHSATRIDFRDHPAFTIDDDDTFEVDDALTVYRSGAEWVVGIHIADVTAFVSKGDLLDVEASRRSTTVYLPSKSVRMFPERLSTDLVSLNAGVDRPACSVEIRFAEDGTQLGHRIALSTIRVARRMSYEEADTDIASGLEGLSALHRIALTLQQARAEKGAITFRRPELKIRVYDGEIRIKKIDSGSPSRLVVSELMILANGLAADFAAQNSLPVIFRTQEPREALPAEAAPQNEAIAFEKLRKTFKRSRLSLTPGPHSGLGLTAYTQTSSPIRRYADLVTQRQFAAFLAGRPTPHTREELLQILNDSETGELETRQLEERSTQYWLLQYLAREKMDTPLQAVVLDGKGTVELEELYMRAKVAGIVAAPGERVAVRIESVDPVKGEVRFKLSS